MSTIAQYRAPKFIRLSRTSLLLVYVVLSAVAGSGPHRIYVEPFTTKAGAETLRRDVIAELRKFPTLMLAANEASADVILDGGGEIWIKGYQSLNPRSGRFSSDGMPLYDGYLAVELRSPNGQTFWSDLVTPGESTTDVSKDLAKRIARNVLETLKKDVPTPAAELASRPAGTLTGAGATFPQPVYAKWFKNYRQVNPSLVVTYSAVGSDAGMNELLSGKVDFGASDSPEVIHDLAPGKEDGYLLFPSVIGAVVPIVNLPGMAGEISLTPEILAGIYLGTIRSWDDPTIKKVNKGIRLPTLQIVVVHRKEGSGTSYAWTDYLSKTVPEWKTQVGAGLNPKWPTGKAALGNEGVAQMVKEFGGAIGYVEYIYALENHLSFTKVRNRDGEYVAASLQSMTIAANEAIHMKENFKVSLVNAPGKGAYPITSFSWFVIPSTMPTDAKREAIKGLLRWVLGPGQLQAAALGYLALPKDVVARENVAVDQIH